MKYLIILPLLLTIFFPDFTLAASGLVPCDGTVDDPCTACHVVDLGNNVIKWLIGILMLVFAITAVTAGFGLVTSGGNVGAKETAKSKFTNAFIGLVIVLAAWLIVDTLMRALLNGGTGVLSNGVYTGSGPWSQIECVAQPTVSTTLPPPPATTPPTGTPTVPGTCSIQPLTPISDSLAQQMESGTTVIWQNTSPQLQACAQKAGFNVVSAYRPPAYQTHLKEIHTKWCVQGLQNNTDAACSSVKSEVSAEMARHGLSCSRPVATVSNHSNGTAIDVSNGGRPAPPNSCLSWFGNADPVHYTLVPNCTCN
jgi:Type IV secretion system pilin